MIDDEIAAKGKTEDTQHSETHESSNDNKTVSKQIEEAETWKDTRMRRPSRKNSFKKAVESPNPSECSVRLVNDMDNDLEVDTNESETYGKENVEEKKSPQVQDEIKSKSASKLTKSKSAMSAKSKSASSSTLQEEEEFKINRPQRKRSVKFMEQPTQIEAPKEGGGTLKRMVSNSGLFKKMKRNRSSEKLRGRKTEEEGPVVKDAGRTPKPQRQPKTPFQERLIL